MDQDLRFAPGALRARLLDYLRHNPDETPRAIAAATGWNPVTVSRCLVRLRRDGVLARDDYARYRVVS